MVSSSSFFDANVLIEVALSRKRQAAAREAIATARGDRIISALTGHLVVHFAGQRVGFATLQAFLSDYSMLELTQADFDWAFANIRDKDFEDALQLAVAIRSDCDEFVTLDRPLYKTYKDLPAIQIRLLS